MNRPVHIDGLQGVKFIFESNVKRMPCTIVTDEGSVFLTVEQDRIIDALILHAPAGADVITIAAFLGDDVSLRKQSSIKTNIGYVRKKLINLHNPTINIIFNYKTRKYKIAVSELEVNK